MAGSATDASLTCAESACHQKPHSRISNHLEPKPSCQRSQDIDVVTHGHDDGRAAERGDLLRDCIVHRKRGQRRAPLPTTQPTRKT